MLTALDRQLIHRQQRWLILQTIVLAGISLVFLIVCAWLTTQPKLTWEAILLLGLGIAGIILGPSPFQLWALQRDLQENQSATFAGKVITEFQVMPGLIPITRYWLHLGPQRFEISKTNYLQFQQGSIYTVRYSPRAKLLLEAVPQASTSPSDEPPTAPAIDLTERELQVLRLLANGLSNDDIARELYLSINTIKMYTSQLYRKLTVTRRTEAIKRAYELKLL